MSGWGQSRILCLQWIGLLCTRLCCKSRKLLADEFFTKIESGKQSLIRTASLRLAKSPVSLTRGDEVPHIFT
jgi:hypothetical protein